MSIPPDFKHLVQPFQNSPGPSFPKDVGLILAGGQSRRFGTDKALFQAPGQSAQVVQVAEAMASNVRQIIISANNDNCKALSQLFKHQPHVTIIKDQAPYTGQGPLSGIYAACVHENRPVQFLMAATDYNHLESDLLAKLSTVPNCYATLGDRDHYTIAHFETDLARIKAFMAQDDRHLKNFLINVCHCKPYELSEEYRQQLTNHNERSARDG